MKELQPNLVLSLEKLEKDSDVEQVAELYANVFATPPWNEYTRCPSCLKFFGLETQHGDSCKICESCLELAYPTEKVIEVVKKEVARPDGTCFILKDGFEIIGFTWGYSYSSPEEFSQDKYRTARMQTGIAELLRQNSITGKFFYYSECGVRETRRGEGNSNRLAEALFTEAIRKKLPIVMRTNWQSPMTAVAERFGMKQIMGLEPQIDRTAKQILPTGISVNNFADSEIEERILFVRL